MGRRPVWRDTPGIRDAGSAQLGLSSPRPSAARLLHPDESRADPVARHQRHLRDAPDSDPDRDTVAAERLAGDRLHRDSVQYLLEALPDCADHPAAARLLAAANAEAPPPRQSPSRQ